LLFLVSSLIVGIKRKLPGYGDKPPWSQFGPRFTRTSSARRTTSCDGASFGQSRVHFRILKTFCFPIGCINLCAEMAYRREGKRTRNTRPELVIYLKRGSSEDRPGTKRQKEGFRGLSYPSYQSNLLIRWSVGHVAGPNPNPDPDDINIAHPVVRLQRSHSGLG
jgi:hypothetical protein